MVTPTEFLTANCISQTDAEVLGNLLRGYEQKVAELPEQQKLTKLCSNAGFSKNVEKGQFFITLDDDAPDDMEGSCREYTLPRSDKSSRVRGWTRGNTKIGPVLDVKVCYHQGRYGVEIMIESVFRDPTVSWVRIVNGTNKHVTETSEEILVASVENRGTGNPVAKAKPHFNVDSCVHSLSWTKMDGRWTRKIQSTLFWSVKIYDQIVTTWWHSSSRRWWSCKIWRPGRIVQVKVCGYFALVNWSLDQLLDRRRRTEEKISVLHEPWFFQTFPVFSEQSRDIQEILSLILHCKTMFCHRTTSSSTSTTSGSLTTCTPSCRVDWFRDKKVSKGQAVCFSQPRTQCTPIKMWKKFNTIWINPESRCTKMFGEFTKIQNIGAIWSSLREKDVKNDSLNRSLQHTTCDMCVEKVVYTKTGEAYTAKYTNPQGYRESYSRQICNMDVRILLNPKRENPPIIKTNTSRSTRTPVASISKKITERILAAETLITEFKVYLIQQFRKKTLIARKS